MEDIFIQNIKVNKAVNLKDFNIPLDTDTKTNLLITGKNGSGKTSLLLELKNFLNKISFSGEEYVRLLNGLQIAENQNQTTLNNSPSTQDQIAQLNNQLKYYRDLLDSYGGTIIKFNNPSLITNYFQNGDFVLAFFDAKRNTTLKTPTGVNQLTLNPVYHIEQAAGSEFIQYIVNLKADRSFAKDDNDLETVIKVDEWFKQFEENLFKLFDSPGIQLEFDRKSYNFNIVENGKIPYNLNQLSGGYSAILSIVTDLILRMEEHRSKSYDVQGIVLIDEIETHLHIELQKKILPFLTSFFPKIQFVVTTHSPFVLSSIKNAVICDLEKRIITTDLSGYSYDTLIESYFDSDKYSLILKKNVKEYEDLLDAINDLNEDEKDKFFDLKRYLNDIPKFISDELAVKIQQLKLRERNNRKKHDLLT